MEQKTHLGPFFKILVSLLCALFLILAALGVLLAAVGQNLSLFGVSAINAITGIRLWGINSRSGG